MGGRGGVCVADPVTCINMIKSYYMGFVAIC